MTATGRPRWTAAAATRREPDTDGDAKKNTAAQQPERADKERRKRRWRKDGDKPPARHETGTPNATARDRNEKGIEPRQKPEPLSAPTAKTATRCGATRQDADNTAASAPLAQPTWMDAEGSEQRKADTTRETMEKEEGSNDLEPPKRHGPENKKFGKTTPKKKPRMGRSAQGRAQRGRDDFTLAHKNRGAKI